MKNILNGIGIFILGIPLVFVVLVFMAVSGVGVTPVIFLVVTYGVLGYVLGKIKPNLKWKSGLMLTLGSVFVVLALAYMRRIVDFNDVQVRNLVLALLGIITIVSILSSYLGSHSRKTWQGSASNIIFVIVVLVTIFGVGSFIIGGLKAQQRMTVPVIPDGRLSP